MRKIEAVIRPEKLDDVRKAIEAVGYPGITITEAEGHGKQKGVVQQWRGETYRVEFLPKIKLEIIVGDADVEQIVQAIIKAAKTGSVGDGKIFVSDVRDVIKIRTGERGDAAL
ncbi:MAG: transcriptional regulator [Candidatus Omnitrophica bacterium CG11_big_fil_rev_8_21_14_0_20_63_9]|nr:MAG: transcriptional regulator [Candidatus Omnitrophica bacterium CG11_big_fil_rev_8_21_14_0_20_63_9]